jgi:YVTN family beta-propeller protein
MTRWPIALVLLVGCGGDDGFDFGGPTSGIGGGTGADGDGAADGGLDDAGTGDGGAPPPEEEEQGDFRVPQASGRLVYSASESSSSVAVIDSETLAIDVVGVGAGPTAVAPLDQSGHVVVLDQGSQDVAMLTTDESGSTTVEIVPVSPGANALAPSPDGAFVVVYHDVDGPEMLGAGSDQELTVIDAQTRAAYEMTVGVHPRDVVFASDGSIAYVVTDDGVNPIPMADLAMLGKPDLVPVIDDPALDPSLVEIAVAADQGVAIARVEGSTSLFATDLSTTQQLVVDLPGIPTDLDLAATGEFAIATLPRLGGSAFVELPIPLGAAPIVHDVDGEYVGLAHLSPDGATMILYTTVDPSGAAPPADPDALGGGGEVLGGSGSSSGSGSTGSDSGSSSEGTSTEADTSSDTGDGGPPPPMEDPRQRVSIVRRDGAGWGEITTLFVDRPVEAAGIAPDGADAILLHGQDAEASGAAWAYTLLDLTKPFPVKKLQTIETPPGPVLFTPEGDRAVMLLRDDGAGVQRVDLIDLRSFIVDALGLGSPPEGAGWVEATDKIFVSQEHPTGRITFIADDGDVQTVTGYRLNDAVKD